MTGFSWLVGLVADEHDGWGHWWLFAPFAWVLWLAAIATVIWLVRRGRFSGRPGPGERAGDILAERFARGELTVEEYRDRLDQLRRSTAERPRGDP